MTTQPQNGWGGRNGNNSQPPFQQRMNRGNGRNQGNRGPQRNNQRGQGPNQRGGFGMQQRGVGRGGPVPQQMLPNNFVIRSGQPQIPGVIPNATTQQVVMVPNNLLQQAHVNVNPYQLYGQVPQQQMYGQPQFAMMNPQLVQQQNMARQQMLQQQQAQAQQQQQQQQQQAQAQKQQQQQQQQQKGGQKPPQQQKQGGQQKPGQPQQGGVQGLNAKQAKTPNKQNSTPPQNPQMPGQQPNQQMLQQQQAQNQKQVAMQMPGQPFFVMNYPQQFFMTQQMQPMQFANFANQQNSQIRIGPAIPPVNQQNAWQQQQYLAMQQQQQQQQGLQGQAQQQANPGQPNQQANQAGPQQSRPPTSVAKPPTTAPPQRQTPTQSKPPTASVPPLTAVNSKGDDKARKEMMAKFQEKASQPPGAQSPDPQRSGAAKAGTPLSAKAAEFVPGSFTSATSATTPTNTTPIIPPTTTPDMLRHNQGATSPVNKGDPTRSVPSPKTPQHQIITFGNNNFNNADFAEEETMAMFDPQKTQFTDVQKMHDVNNLDAKSISLSLGDYDATSPGGKVDEDVKSSPEKVAEDDVKSSPRSTNDDDATSQTEENAESSQQEEDEKNCDPENQIYTIKYLVKASEWDICKNIHDTLRQSMCSPIRSSRPVRVKDIFSESSRNHRKGGGKYQRSGMSRDSFGTKKQQKKKTPKPNKRHNPNKHHHHPNYPPLLRVEPLSRSSDAWHITHKQKNHPNQKLRKQSLGLLNKITLENKQTISEQFTEIILTSVKHSDHCNVVVSTVFEKSCAEPKFSNLYADLCYYTQNSLAGVDIEQASPEQMEAGADMKSLFRRSIINLCQHNFNERLNLDALSEKSDEDKIDYLDTTKRRMMGNIKFIGDLFKHRLIHESIIHHIIAKMLTPDGNWEEEQIARRKLDDQLEGCCRMLETVGKEIDSPKAKEWIDQYFDYMEHFQKGSVSRIHFMVLGIQELRANNWVPRIEKETVKLKSEVRKEFEREQHKKTQVPMRGKHQKRGFDNNHRRDSRSNIMRTGGQPGRNPNAWGQTSNKRNMNKRSSHTGSQDARASKSITPIASTKRSKDYAMNALGSGRIQSTTPTGRRGLRQGPGFSPLTRQQSAPPGMTPPAQQQQKQSQGGSLRSTFAEEFKTMSGDPKSIDDKKLNAWLEKGTSHEAQSAIWGIFFEHYMKAHSQLQKSMLLTFQMFNRKSKVDVEALLDWMKTFSKQIETFQDDEDSPNTPQYYGVIMAELVITNRLQVNEILTTYAPKTVEKETNLNLYMTGVIQGLVNITDPPGEQFVLDHASELKVGFRLNPNDYGNPARRKKLPTPQDLPVMKHILGEDYA